MRGRAVTIDEVIAVASIVAILGTPEQRWLGIGLACLAGADRLGLLRRTKHIARKAIHRVHQAKWSFWIWFCTRVRKKDRLWLVLAAHAKAGYKWVELVPGAHVWGRNGHYLCVDEKGRKGDGCRSWDIIHRLGIESSCGTGRTQDIHSMQVCLWGVEKDRHVRYRLAKWKPWMKECPTSKVRLRR